MKIILCCINIIGLLLVFPFTSQAAVNPLPLLVEIENAQYDSLYGISDASVLIEMIVEGPGYTGLIAILDNTLPELIGPVGGGTSLGLSLHESIRGTYIFSGTRPIGDDRLYTRIKEKGSLASIVIDGSKAQDRSFFVPGEATPRSLFQPYAFWESAASGASTRTLNPTPFFQSSVDTKSEKPIEKQEISLVYRPDYVVRYAFDSVTGRYHRYINDVPQVDAATREPLLFANVVILAFPTYFLQHDWRFPFVSATGAGSMVCYRDGGLLEGNWMRLLEVDRYTFFSPSGDPLPFSEGRSIVHILPMHMYDSEGFPADYDNTYWYLVDHP